MSNRFKIRIFYLFSPGLDKDACSFFLLSQNAQQDVFEFEIHYLDNYEIDYLGRKPIEILANYFPLTPFQQKSF